MFAPEQPAHNAAVSAHIGSQRRVWADEAGAKRRRLDAEGCSAQLTDAQIDEHFERPPPPPLLPSPRRAATKSRALSTRRAVSPAQCHT
jgi:hypothetical protein